jgi:molybdopterin synthase sulfur carrier subunit
VATVWVPAQLRGLTNGQETVMVPGERVGQIVEALDSQFPGFKARLCEGAGLRPGIAIVVDGEVARFGLLQAVEASSEIHFVPAIGGG